MDELLDLAEDYSYMVASAAWKDNRAQIEGYHQQYLSLLLVPTTARKERMTDDFLRGAVAMARIALQIPSRRMAALRQLALANQVDTEYNELEDE